MRESLGRAWLRWSAWRTDRFVEGQLTAAGLALLVVVTRWRLPDELSIVAAWPVPLIQATLAILLVIADWSDGTRQNWSRPFVLALVTVLLADNLVTAVLLVQSLVSTSPDDAVELLSTSAQVLLTNVIAFALLYWAIDRGGPVARVRGTTREADFLFPQMTDPSWSPPDWRPQIGDYLYTAFTAIMAFSPTDTMPLTRRAKFCMSIQAIVAGVTILITLSRAINVLP